MTLAGYGTAPFASSETGVLAGAVGWLSGTVTGTIATLLCIVAIAALGLMMLAGRLPVREGVRVVLGCFVLLGAPAIAAGLLGLGQASAGTGEQVAPPVSALSEPRPDLSAAGPISGPADEVR